MTDLMIDIETLSTQKDAAITSIGAVFFDRHTGLVGQHKHHVGIQMLPAHNYGHIDPGTVQFWISQKKTVQEQLLSLTASQSVNARTLAVALASLTGFIHTFSDPENVLVWSNGSNFDIEILENAYTRTCQKVPWKYYNVRDVRTIVDIGRDILKFDPKKTIPFTGSEHNALDDAVHQANYVSAIFKEISNLY